MQINAISCTGFQAIYGVFYVLGFDTDRIKDALYAIKKLFKPKQNLK